MFVFLQRFRSYEGILIESSLGDHRPSQTVTRGLTGLPGPPLVGMGPNHTVLRAGSQTLDHRRDGANKCRKFELVKVMQVL